MHTPTVEKLPTSSVGNADPRQHLTIGIHQHIRERATEKCGRWFAAPYYIVGHCEFVYGFPQAATIHRVKGFCQTHEGIVNKGSQLLSHLSWLAGTVYQVGYYAVSSKAPFDFRERYVHFVTVQTNEKDKG
ncbi:unnamed protein product [Schistocephalus solidus]|uniref:LCCL domain-containing protein n=1 Tax=Schistocephalus solidus TaxID=70667 RepID=A0A183T765_SCHSO|nr:unnamed protein product [Schistocephalus solidus]